MPHRGRRQQMQPARLAWQQQVALGLVILLCAFAASAVLIQPSLSASPAKVEPALLKRVLEGKPSSRYRFIVELSPKADHSVGPQSLSRSEQRYAVVAQLQATARQSQEDLLALLIAGKATHIQSFWTINAIAVTADAETLLEVATRPEVHIVREDRWRRWLDPDLPIQVEVGVPTRGEAGDAGEEWNIALVRANLVWQALGLDGSGVTVAFMDTGVDWQHPVLQAQYRGYKVDGLVMHEGNWACTTDEDYLYPVDGSGHGTHVTGIAVGGRDTEGRAIGIAPGASWIAVKMLNNEGYGYDSWIHAAFQWLMAPAGDPGLAPEVVNGSWGARDGEDERFRADVQALRAAGIVPVFAAGNHGPDDTSLGRPASYPEAIAVGASDDVDSVVRISSRGPSPWDEFKPEVVAPGIQVRSSLPGGTYGRGQGTSMAAPHVSGLAALLLQADPGQTVDQLERLITSTALPLGDQVPNNDTGWGRIDAYRAATVARQAGYVAGQITRLPEQQPLPGSRVTVRDDSGQHWASVTSDELGGYRVALPPGRYDLQFEAFGYKPRSERGIRVRAAATATLDVGLYSLPTGTLQGQVTEAVTGEPVGADLSLSDTPASTRSDPQTGRFSIALPRGTYDLVASRNGSRRQTLTDIKVATDQVTEVDIVLVPAPTLLLVDSGPWYYDSQVSYFERALADGDYVHDTWQIRDLVEDLPDPDDLAPYDIVIWSSPTDSPGLIGAGDTISDYLGMGGNLFITGQDVGFWDDGLSGRSWHEYYGQFLKARALHDDAGRDPVVGLPGELLGGLILPLNGPDSAENQITPDLVALREPRGAVVIGHYGTRSGSTQPAGHPVESIAPSQARDLRELAIGESNQWGEDAGSRASAVRAGGCSPYSGKDPYRTVYLAAGLEGLGTGPQRAEVMDRALAWLDMPHPAAAIELYPVRLDEVWLGGSSVTYTLELRNRGLSTDRFDLTLSPSAWPATVWDGDFSQPIDQSVTLGACQTQTLGIEVAVPPGVVWNAADVVTLTARSQSEPAQRATAAFHSKAPAPVLLVDDHRWYDTLAAYRGALEANGYPYDVWRIDPGMLPERASPSLRRLHSYPVVIWFTAYDWHSTLTAQDEALLASYLNEGGRLLLSSQDYLYTNGLTAFANRYLGVAGYTENVTATLVMGAVGNPVGNGLAEMDLKYPFGNWTDALRPTPSASVAFWGQHGQPTSLILAEPNRQADSVWKSSFFAIPLEALQTLDMATVVGQTVDWLSPLGDSSFAVDRFVVDEGEPLTYTLQIRNDGPAPLSKVSLTNDLPSHTSYVAGSLEGPAVYEPARERFIWQGPLSPGETINVRYRLRLDPRVPDGTMVRNVANLRYESGLVIERVALSRVAAPDLSGSAKTTSHESAYGGRVLTYTFHLRNRGLRPAQATLLDPIPPLSTYLPGSAWASSGHLEASPERFWWSGPIRAAEVVTLGFRVLVVPTVASLYVHNRADLDDGEGDMRPLETTTWVEAQAFLPFMAEQE